MVWGRYGKYITGIVYMSFKKCHETASAPVQTRIYRVQSCVNSNVQMSSLVGFGEDMLEVVCNFHTC